MATGSTASRAPPFSARSKEADISALKILVILTSHAALGASGHPTGLWFEELATPYYAFVDAGAEVEIASVAGGKAPIDPRSLAQAPRPKSVERFLADAKAMDKIEHTTPVGKEALGDYAAVFLPGGHGTMWDLPDSAPLKICSARPGPGAVSSAPSAMAPPDW